MCCAREAGVRRHRISAFRDTPLDSILRALHVKTLFFAGVNADHCVLATLMDASFQGYDTALSTTSAFASVSQYGTRTPCALSEIAYSAFCRFG